MRRFSVHAHMNTQTHSLETHDLDSDVFFEAEM